MKKFGHLITNLLLICIFTLIMFILYLKYDIQKHFEEEKENGHRPDTNYRFGYREKVNYYGFHFEEHEIETEDGYILTAWRIVKKDPDGKISQKKAVILTHGLLDSSYTFLAFGEKKCLPLILAEKNFDVWLTNNRGTLFSHKHVDPNKDSSKLNSDYWNFTFHEMAKYDVVSNIDYIKKITNNKKISYICHSQGCFQFLIGYILNNKFFDESVEKFGTMGAVLKISEINKYFPKIIKYIDLFGWFDFFGIKNIMSFNENQTKYFGYLCNRFLFICKYVISGIIENEATNKIDYRHIQNFYYYAPGGTSAKNLRHWLQIIESPVLKYFDYGVDKNTEIYNSPESPLYEVEILKKINFDVFLTISNGDPYCIQKDYDEIYQYLTSAKVYKKHVQGYNHLDYLWGTNAHLEIYEDLYNFLMD